MTGHVSRSRDLFAQRSAAGQRPEGDDLVGSRAELLQSFQAAQGREILDAIGFQVQHAQVYALGQRREVNDPVGVEMQMIRISMSCDQPGWVLYVSYACVYMLYVLCVYVFMFL